MLLRPFCPTGIPIANQWRQCKRSENIYVEACPSVQAALDPSYISPTLLAPPAAVKVLRS